MASSGKSVAVVGGGVAGLAAAWHLAEQGHAVTLLEREKRVGGRAWSESVEGFTLEPFVPIFTRADREILAWIEKVGLRDEMVPLRPMLVSQLAKGREVPCESNGGGEPALPPGLPRRERLRLMRFPRLLRRYASKLDFERPELAADLDDRSLADFGRLYFGRGAYERWMEPLTCWDGGGDGGDKSRVQFLLRHQRGADARHALPRGALREALEAAALRCHLVCSARVTALRCTSPERADAPIEILYERDGAELGLEVDAVVLAVTAPQAAKLGAEVLTTGEREILAAVSYAPTATLALALCRPLSLHVQWLRVPRSEGSAIESMLSEPGQRVGRIPDGSGLLSLRANSDYAREALERPEAQVKDELIEQAEALRPGLRGCIDFSRLYRVERAFPAFAVGHYRALARLARIEQQRCERGPKLMVTGDYRIDASWSGAYLAGRRSALELGARLRAAAA